MVSFEQKEAAVRMYQSGVQLRQLCQQVGISSVTLYRILQEARVAKRKLARSSWPLERQSLKRQAQHLERLEKEKRQRDQVAQQQYRHAVTTATSSSFRSCRK